MWQFLSHARPNGTNEIELKRDSEVMTIYTIAVTQLETDANIFLSHVGRNDSFVIYQIDMKSCTCTLCIYIRMHGSVCVCKREHTD